jgi:nitrate reductase gamma subunit
MSAWIDHFLFGLYPYICLAVFFIGSWVRFDRDQYTWKSDSSQLLRTGSLRWASNLFHIGVLFLFFGHFVGMLTPHAVYEPFISAGHKQVLAMVSGGIAGLLGFIGVTLLLHRACRTRASAPPARPATSPCCGSSGCSWRWAWPPSRCRASTWTARS